MTDLLNCAHNKHALRLIKSQNEILPNLIVMQGFFGAIFLHGSSDGLMLIKKNQDCPLRVLNYKKAPVLVQQLKKTTKRFSR